MAPAPPQEPISPEALAAVRPQVRAMLEAIPAFAQMSDSERRRLAGDLVKVLGYIADPGCVASASAGGAPPAEGLAQRDTIRNFGSLVGQTPGQVGQDFRAGAVREGVEQFGALVQKVDFPKFVGGLIKNVFEAIVESSIEQMRAFGELVAAVAKSTDDFMRDNIGEGQARDWLVNRFPDSLGLDLSGGAGSLAEGDGPPPAARVTTTGEDPERALAEASAELGVIPPVTDLSDPAQELRLVTAARLHLARQRQQLLASMVMMGINRIVVTDGSINAKVVFDMRAQDSARRESRAAMLDQTSSANRNRTRAGAGGWGWGVATDNINEQRHMATVSSAVDDTSESRAEVKAKLSGEVRVNFKSDYLPLEKMATPGMMSVIQGNSQPFDPNRPASAPAAG